MSEKNVENIMQAVEAFNRRDADGFIALVTPEVEWEDAIFWSGETRTYRGRDELREWFAQVVEPWENVQVEVQEIMETDDRMLVGLSLTGRGKGSGVEAPELHVWQVNWFADGKTARRQVFLERADALEAAGLEK